MRSYFFYIKRLFTLPPHLAASKIARFLLMVFYSKIEKIKIKSFGGGISNNGFTIALNEEVTDILKKIAYKSNAFLTEYRSGNIQEIIKKDLNGIEKIISSADSICEHKFDLLGSGKVFLGAKIDWLFDFKTGYRWNVRQFCKDIEIPYGKGDIKIPWELSRFQHFTILGQAYCISKDEKYAAEFIGQIKDWIESNPVKLGPNWACTMDVAIRAANWLVGWEFFRLSERVTEDFISLFLKSLYEHGRFIRTHLENATGLTSNHYLSDISGLFFISVMVPELRESAKWLEFSKSELETEIQKQVYEDGCDFEASTCYHRLVTELFFYPAILARRAGIIFSDNYNQKLKKMFESLLYIMKPNGRIPQIGDNDNGRFFKFESPDNEILDVRYLLPLAAIYFDDPKFKRSFSDEGKNTFPDFNFSLLWLFGEEALQKWNNMPCNRIDGLESKEFCDSGWYVMRNKKDYMLISCGPNGQDGNGGHAHNDKLSFELSVNGHDVIVDPGTYVYTSDPQSRNTFRSTRSHNTIVVDNMEQNQFVDDALFILPDNTKAAFKKWFEDGLEIIFEGVHYGYQAMKKKVLHNRVIVYNKRDREYFFEDRLSGTNRADLKLSLHFAPDFLLQLLPQGALRADNESINIIVEFEDNLLSPAIEGYLYSRSYGKAENATRAVFSGFVDLPCKLRWKIRVKL